MSKNTQPNLEAVTNILKEYQQSSISIQNSTVLKDSVRNLVYRCDWNSGITESDQSVIVKQILHTPQCGYTDWASLEFIKKLRLDNIVPEFIGGDVDEGLFVMQDLGDHPTLNDLLHDTDFKTVSRSLISLAKKTARLHAGTLGNTEYFEQIRSVLPERGEPIRYQQAKDWHEGLKKVENWMKVASINIPSDFIDTLEIINQLYREPGPFICFTHGDMAPTNNLTLPDGEVYLLDFEYGGNRHALYDITAWNLLCPLPDELVQVINDTYLKELLAQSPLRMDEELYRRDYVYISAWRGFAILSWIPTTILEEDRLWVEDWTMRQAVLAVLRRLNQSCQDQPELAPLLVCTQELEVRLLDGFDDFETIFPHWPALD